MSRNSLLETGVISKVEVIAKGFETKPLSQYVANFDKWVSVRLQTKWLWIGMLLLPLKFVFLLLFCPCFTDS